MKAGYLVIQSALMKETMSTEAARYTAKQGDTPIKKMPMAQALLEIHKPIRSRAERLRKPARKPAGKRLSEGRVVGAALPRSAQAARSESRRCNETYDRQKMTDNNAGKTAPVSPPHGETSAIVRY